MNSQRNNLLARKAILERAHRAYSFVVIARAVVGRNPAFGSVGHGLALPEAGDLIA
jgi:hypothetical protein